MSIIHHHFTTLASIAAFIGFTACQQNLDVTVGSDGQGVYFQLPMSKPPCINRVTAYDARDLAIPIWLIDTDDRSSCVTRFRYGEVPKGFVARGPTAKLTSEAEYIVNFGGPGVTGSTRFKLQRDGGVARMAD